MKKLVLVLVCLLLMGCGVGSQNSGALSQYDTIAHKDISVKVRTFGVDVDYDSRVAIDPRELHPMAPLEPLEEVKPSAIEPLEELK